MPAGANIAMNGAIYPTLCAKFKPGESIYNEQIGKLSGKTFRLVNILQTKVDDSFIARIGKIFASFLLVATIFPLVGLFATAGAASLYRHICSKLTSRKDAPAVPQQPPRDIVGDHRVN